MRISAALICVAFVTIYTGSDAAPSGNSDSIANFHNTKAKAASSSGNSEPVANYEITSTNAATVDTPAGQQRALGTLTATAVMGLAKYGMLDRLKQAVMGGVSGAVIGATTGRRPSVTAHLAQSYGMGGMGYYG